MKYGQPELNVIIKSQRKKSLAFNIFINFAYCFCLFLWFWSKPFIFRYICRVLVVFFSSFGISFLHLHDSLQLIFVIVNQCTYIFTTKKTLKQHWSLCWCTKFNVFLTCYQNWMFIKKLAKKIVISSKINYQGQIC